MTVQSTLSSTSTETEASSSFQPNWAEKPRNGLKGLKHWKSDLLAGLLVALISTPFSIGIAIASGAPAITGITSAIVAGFILPFLGGSYVTISGPAAGLAPTLYSAMLVLGAGRLDAGYPLLLPLIAFAGILQILLSRFKVARLASVFPAPVVEGMLTAIGLMIILKQIPALMGFKAQAHEIVGLIAELPQQILLSTNLMVFVLGASTIALIAVLSVLGQGHRFLRYFPPTMAAVTLMTLISLAFNLQPSLLTHIPENPLHGIVLPDFQGLLASPNLWWAAIGIVITLTLIDGIESLATVQAVDKIDPYKRHSNPDKTLFAMGISNICSSMVGGLTIIPGGVKSTANVMAGGKTQWANFYNACFLLVFLLFCRDVINLMPLSVLAAVLIWTGYKLCKPLVWKKVYSVGLDQFVLYVGTILITLSTDLLWGIIGGIVLSVLVNAALLTRWHQKSKQNDPTRPQSLLRVLVSMFQSPIKQRILSEKNYTLILDKPLVCSNYFSLACEFNNLPKNVETILIELTPDVLIKDHTTFENIENVITTHNQFNPATKMLLVGDQGLKNIYASAQSTKILDVEAQMLASMS